MIELPEKKLVQIVKTKQNAQSLTQEIKELKTNLYRPSGANLSEEHLVKNYPNVANFWKQSGLQDSLLKDVTTLDEILRIINCLPTITIEVNGIEGVTEKYLLEWSENSTKQPTLIDVKLNPNINGGLLINLQGKVLDRSLDTLVENYIKSNYAKN